MTVHSCCDQITRKRTPVKEVHSRCAEQTLGKACCCCFYKATECVEAGITVNKNNRKSFSVLDVYVPKTILIDD